VQQACNSEPRKGVSTERLASFLESIDNGHVERESDLLFDPDDAQQPDYQGDSQVQAL